MSTTRILIMTNVLACFCMATLYAHAGDNAKSKTSLASVVNVNNNQNLADVRIATTGSTAPAKTISAHKNSKTKTKPQTKKNDKPEAPRSGLLSWILTDSPNAPSVRSPKDGNTGMPRFK